MAIFNMVGGGSGGGVIVPLDAISDLSAVSDNAKVTIKWTDPTDPTYNGITLVSWTSTKLVRKVGSAPTNSSDGTVVLTETTRNQYSSSGYVDSGLTNGTTYYYAAFAIGDNGTETISNVEDATPDADYLCFTANTAGSTIQLNVVGSPGSRSFQTSTDKSNWTSYTLGSTITLSNIGDKVYRRNATNSVSSLASSTYSYHQFVMTGSIAGSGDIEFLLRKDGYDSMGAYCFIYLFSGCTALTTPPKLPAMTMSKYCYFGMFEGCTSLTVAPELPSTTLAEFCYRSMFEGCTALTTPPKLPATTLVGNYDYGYMFSGCTNLDKLVELPALSINTGSYRSMYENCSKIKLSTTKTGDYQTEYRIPTTGTGTAGTNALSYMFNGTGGTYTSFPSVNTTYYTSNTVISND